MLNRKWNVLPLSFLLSALLLSLLAPLQAQTVRGGRHSDLIITGRNMNRTYSVRGQDVIVRGNGNRIVWTGDSPLLRVIGNNNRVEADAVRAVIISGRNNTVHWKRRYNGRSPRVSRSGSGNWVMFNGSRTR